MAPGAARPRVQADTGARAPDPRRGRGVPPRPGPADAQPFRLAAEPVRRLPRGAVQARRRRVRGVAQDEVVVELRARPPPRRRGTEDPPGQDALSQRGHRGPCRSDRPRRDRPDGGGGRGLGPRARPPRRGRAVDARRPGRRARPAEKGAEGDPRAARALRRRRHPLGGRTELPRPLGSARHSSCRRRAARPGAAGRRDGPRSSGCSRARARAVVLMRWRWEKGLLDRLVEDGALVRPEPGWLAAA
jgi:hypothetical protein